MILLMNIYHCRDMHFTMLLYQGSMSITCLSSSTTGIAVCYGTYVGIFMDELFNDISRETLESMCSIAVDGALELSLPR